MGLLSGLSGVLPTHTFSIDDDGKLINLEVGEVDCSDLEIIHYWSGMNDFVACYEICLFVQNKEMYLAIFDEDIDDISNIFIHRLGDEETGRDLGTVLKMVLISNYVNTRDMFVCCDEFSCAQNIFLSKRGLEEKIPSLEAFLSKPVHKI